MFFFFFLLFLEFFFCEALVQTIARPVLLWMLCETAVHNTVTSKLMLYTALKKGEKAFFVAYILFESDIRMRRIYGLPFSVIFFVQFNGSRQNDDVSTLTYTCRETSKLWPILSSLSMNGRSSIAFCVWNGNGSACVIETKRCLCCVFWIFLRTYIQIVILYWKVCVYVICSHVLLTEYKIIMWKNRIWIEFNACSLLTITLLQTKRSILQLIWKLLFSVCLCIQAYCILIHRVVFSFSHRIHNFRAFWIHRISYISVFYSFPIFNIEFVAFWIINE